MPRVRSPLALTLALFALVSPATAQAQRREPRPVAPVRADPYAGYDALLRSVVRRGLVDYGALRARLPELRAFCDWLADNGPTATPAAFATAPARLAYWLNAYNAFVLRSVAESPPSMRNVLTSSPNNGFFRARTHRVDRRELTLDAIENREVRERFRDPRAHVALNCGARSCPPLAAEAFSPRRLDAQLDRLASAWVASGAVVLDPSARTLRASSLLQWFAEDFRWSVRGRPDNTAVGPLRFVYAFASPSLRASLESACGADGARCRLEFAPYDWSLNSAP